MLNDFNSSIASGTYINALVLDKNNIGIDPVVRQSLLTFYQRNLYVDHLPNNPMRSIIDFTVDKCIQRARHQNFNYLILTWEGNIFNIHEYHQNCIKHIEQLNQKTNGEWLVSGHIMDQYENRKMFNDPQVDEWKNSYYLFPITAVVNIEQWEKLGRPSWGETGVQRITKIKRSAENIHDNYTPLEISLNSQVSETVETRVKASWNLIDTSVKNNLPVFNISEGIRKSQNYLYPEVNVNRYNSFWTSMYSMPKLTDQYKRVFESIIHSKYPRRISDHTWQCFIRNTEDYFPKTELIHLNTEVDWSVFDAVALPCSGFKDFIVTMGNQSAKKPVQVLHFDIIEQCVSIKRSIIEQWDGTRANFEKVLLLIGERYRPNAAADTYHMHSMTKLEQAYDHMLAFFDSEEDLQQCWQKFKTFEHHYITADMLDDPFAAIKLLKGKNIYICLSDIAGWRNNIVGYGYQTLRNDLHRCVQSIRNKGIDGVVDYKDPATDLQMWQKFDVALEYLKKPLPADYTQQLIQNGL